MTGTSRSPSTPRRWPGSAYPRWVPAAPADDRLALDRAVRPRTAARCSRATVFRVRVDPARRDPVDPSTCATTARCCHPGRRQPARAPPRPPEPLGRLGPRRPLPAPGHAARPTLDELRRRGRRGGVRRSFGASTVEQRIALHLGRIEIDTDVDWHEREKVLKLAVDCDVHADEARYETQFGHVVRPTHVNTSWDAARFEVCAHRWALVAEEGYGVALANRHDVRPRRDAPPRPDGGTYSRIAGEPAPRAAVPRPRHRPGPALVPARDRARRRRRRGRAGGLRPQPAPPPPCAVGAVEPLVERRRRPGVRRGGQARRGRVGRPGRPAVRAARRPGPGAGHGVVRDVWCARSSTSSSVRSTSDDWDGQSSRSDRSRSSPCAGISDRSALGTPAARCQAGRARAALGDVALVRRWEAPGGRRRTSGRTSWSRSTWCGSGLVVPSCETATPKAVRPPTTTTAAAAAIPIRAPGGRWWWWCRRRGPLLVGRGATCLGSGPSG